MKIKYKNNKNIYYYYM